MYTGASLDIKGYGENTALNWAKKKNYQEIVRTLLEAYP